MAFYLGPRKRPVEYYNKVMLQTTTNSGSTTQTTTDSLNKDPDKSALSAIPRLTGISSLPFVSTSSKPAFVFDTVLNIDYNYARDVATQYGLMSFTLVPWYTKAVVVQIQGMDYLGAFLAKDTIGSLLPTSGTTMMRSILNEMKKVDNVILGHKAFLGSTNFNLANTIMSAIRIGNAGEDDSRKYYGFIQDFKVRESVENPFIQSYTLTYIGVDSEFLLNRSMSGSLNPKKGLELNNKIGK